MSGTLAPDFGDDFARELGGAVGDFRGLPVRGDEVVQLHFLRGLREVFGVLLRLEAEGRALVGLLDLTAGDLLEKDGRGGGGVGLARAAGEAEGDDGEQEKRE